VIKARGKWLRPLRFLGLEYNGATNKLKARTKKGAELEFDK
jgi:hypothetical protein